MRNLRAEMKAAPSKKLVVYLRGATEDEIRYTTENFSYLENLAGISEVKVAREGEALPPCSSKPLRKAEVLIPMKGLVDATSEIKRLEEMEKKLEGNIRSGEARLSNQAFTSKAPAKIIEGAKAQLELNRAQLEKVKSQLTELRSI